MDLVSPQLLNEGLEHHRAGAFKQAEQLYRRSLKLHPKNPDALALLGHVLCDQGQHQKGFDFLRKAVRAQPSNPKYPLQLGKALGAAGRLNEAVRAFRKAIALAPGKAELHFELGRAYLAHANMEPAILALEKAHQLQPENLDYRYTLASARLRLGELPADTSHFRALVEARPDSAVYHCQLGTALRLNNEFDEAQHHYERALESQEGFPEAVGGLAQVYESTGRTDQADRLLRACIDQGEPNFTVVVAFVRICKGAGRPGDAIGLVKEMLGDPSTPPFHRMTLLFRLGDLYEELGSYDEAWACYQQANELHVVRWNNAALEKMIQSVIESFSAEAMKSLPRSSIRSDLPIFIVGMFRSGTSLTDQIVASHQSAHGAGELTDIHRIAMTLHKTLQSSARYPKCVASLSRETLDELASKQLEKLNTLGSNAIRVSDKNPLNYMHLGLIALLFPNARIIHCTRDPLDTCVSCYANSFSTAHAYTQNLSDLAHAYTQYRRLMKHWREVLDLPMMELRYEQLIGNQERVTRELLEFCGLAWDEACLRFHESKRVLQTLSKDQIRRPLYTSSIGRAKRFQKYLDPLKETLVVGT